MLTFYLDGQETSPVSDDRVFRQGNTYVLSYPCTSTNECENYFSFFPPGRYIISLYGASGGGKVVSTKRNTDNSACENQDEAV